MGEGERRSAVAWLVIAMALLVATDARAGTSPSRSGGAGASLVHDVNGLVVRTETIAGACLLFHGSARVPAGDCDPLPPKKWLVAGETDPAVAWLEERLAPFSTGPLVGAYHFRNGTRTAFVFLALPAGERPRFGFDPKPSLDAAWHALEQAYPPIVPLGPTPEATETRVSGLDAYRLEGEHTRAGTVQHTSMTVIPSSPYLYVLVSAGPPSAAAEAERAALLEGTEVRSPPSSFALGPGVGYRIVGALIVLVAAVFLRVKTGISPFGWLRRSR